MIKALKKKSKNGNEYYALFYVQGEVEVFLAYLREAQYNMLVAIQK